MVLTLILPNTSFAQPAKYTQNEYATDLNDSTIDDWIYDMFTTVDCNYTVFCGFAKKNNNNNTVLYRKPTVGKVNSHTGEKEWIYAYAVPGYTYPYTYLQKIHEVNENDHIFYIATGSIKENGSNDSTYQSLIIKVDEDGNLLNGYPKVIESPNTGNAIRMNTSTAIKSGNEATGLITAGRDNAGTYAGSHGIIMKYNVDGSLDQAFGNNGVYLRTDATYYTNVAIQYDGQGEAIAIFAIGDKMNVPWDGPGSNNNDPARDHDVLITKLDMEGNLLAEVTFDEFDLESNAGYVDVDSGNEFLFCQSSPLEDSTFNSENHFQRGNSILIDNGNIYLGCYFDYHYYASACNPFSQTENYIEADMALISMNDALDQYNWATNVDRYIGLDFESELIMVDGKIITDGSHASFTGSGNTLTSVEVRNSISSIDPNTGNVIWTKDVKNSKPVDCPFAITANCDNDILVGGNSAESFIENMEAEEYFIIKVQNPCQSLINDFDIASGLEINTSVVWNTDKKVKGTIKIKAGGSLTINSGAAVQFASTHELIDYDLLATNDPANQVTKIIVEPGGSLVLDHCTLRGLEACGRNWMWEGVEVAGDPTKSSQISSEQGNISMNYATIQDARLGVLLDKGYYNQNGNCNATQLYGGGKITSENSSFLNCRKAVHFAPFTPANTSFFTTTSFTNNAPMLDATYTSADGARYGTATFVSLWDVSRVRFTTSAFTQSSGFTGSRRATGIVSDDARYKVLDGCTFSNLDKAIYARAVDPLKNLEVSNANVFTNCQQGIYLKGGAFHYIGEGNVFNLSVSNQNDLLLEVSAIRLDGTSSTVIENNTINGGTPSSSSYLAQYGIIAENTGDNASFTFKNQFNDLFIGNQTQKDNGGLQIRCNDYTDHAFAWAINPQSTGAFSDQGECGPNKNQAGNQFLDAPCVNGQYSYIYSSLAFDYRYNLNGNNENPQCKTTNVNTDNCSGQTNDNSCNQRATITSSNVSQYTNYLSSISDPFTRQLLRADIIRYRLDTGDINNTRSLLAGETSDHWKRIRALAELYNGDLLTAQTVASSIPGTGDDNIDFASLLSILYDLKSNNHTWRNLNNTQKQTLNTLASSRTQAAYTAQGILETTFGNSYSPILETINNTGGSKLIKNQAIESANIASNNLIIQPNPVGNEALLLIPENVQSEHSLLIITNTIGHIVLSKQIEKQTTQVILDTSHLPSNYYFIQLIGRSSSKFSTKFIK